MNLVLLQLVPVWDSTYCGQYRSIVRMIGTNLPLSPLPRLRFQVNMYSVVSGKHVFCGLYSVMFFVLILINITEMIYTTVLVLCIYTHSIYSYFILRNTF